METFDQVWESSRYNVWTWVCYGICIAGIVGVFKICRPPISGVKVLKTVALIGMTSFAAFLVSGARTARKWEIRQNWVVTNMDLVTEEERSAAFADGANLIVGPHTDAMITLFVLLFTAVISSFRGTKLSQRILQLRLRKEPEPPLM